MNDRASLYEQIKSGSDEYKTIFSSLGLSSKCTSSPMISKLIDFTDRNIEKVKNYTDCKFLKFSNSVSALKYSSIVKPVPSLACFKFESKSNRYSTDFSLPKGVEVKTVYQKNEIIYKNLIDFKYHSSIDVRLSFNDKYLECDFQVISECDLGEEITSFYFMLSGETDKNYQVKEWLMSNVDSIILNEDVEVPINNIKIQPLSNSLVSELIFDDRFDLASNLKIFSAFEDISFFFSLNILSEFLRVLPSGLSKLKLFFKKPWLGDFKISSFDSQVVKHCLPMINCYKNISSPCRFEENVNEYNIHFVNGDIFFPISVQSLKAISSDFSHINFENLIGANIEEDRVFFPDFPLCKNENDLKISFDKADFHNEYECFTVESQGFDMVTDFSSIGENELVGEHKEVIFKNVKRPTSVVWPSLSIFKSKCIQEFNHVSLRNFENPLIFKKWLMLCFDSGNVTKQIDSIESFEFSQEYIFSNGAFVYSNQISILVSSVCFINLSFLNHFFSLIFSAVENLIPAGESVYMNVVDSVTNKNFEYGDI